MFSMVYLPQVNMCKQEEYFMKLVKENMNTIVICILEILIGSLLLIDPIAFTSTIIIAVGIVLIALGILSVLKYFRTAPEEAAKSQNLLKGLLALTLGSFCALNSYWFIHTFPLFTILYGTIMIVAGLGKVQWAVDALRLHKKWILPASSALVTLICGILVLNNPFEVVETLWMFTGIAMILEAVFDIVAMVMANKVTPMIEETTEAPVELLSIPEVSTEPVENNTTNEEDPLQ